MRGNKIFKSVIRSFYLMITIMGLLTLAGCWSAEDIDELATISVIGIDENEAGQVEVTTAISNSKTLFAETAVPESGQDKVLIQTTTGESIFEAFGELSRSNPEQLYFGHVDAIIFGDRAARERMLSSIEFFKRQNEFRPNMQLLVTEGKASELIKTIPQQNTILGLEIKDLVLSSRFSSTDMVQDISQFIADVSDNTTDPITGVISSAEKQGINTDENKRDTATNSDGEGDKPETEEDAPQDIPKALSLKGTAVFKGERLKGFLDERETRGLLWIKGELKNEIVVLKCGENNDETISLAITDSKSQLTPEISGRIPKMSVNIQVEANIGQVACPDINLDTQEVNRLNQQLENLVRQEVTETLEKAKNQWQTDIFGFGTAIHQKYPGEWKQIASGWRNGLLKDMEMDLKVSANISRYGLLKDPAEVNEEK